MTVAAPRPGTMKVGLYHNDLPVPGRKPGGVAVLVHRLARELSARGHEITVWTRGPAPADANYQHVRLWPRLQSDSRALRTFVVPLLLQSVAWRDLDVLHLHGDDFLMLRRTLPTVRTLHGSALLEARHATSAKRRLSYGVIAGLEYLSARLATGSYGVGPGVPRLYPTVGTLDNGVHVPAHVPLEREGPPAILFVGTWDGRKRGRFLHRLFLEQVQPAVHDAELWMVSDHCDPAPGVRWLGAPGDDELMTLYRRAWVLCHPSTYEGLGIPYLEAMANGTPIASTPNPGARYVLGEQLAACTLVGDGNLGELLVRLLTDEAVRRERAEQGRQRVLRFSWDEVVERHLDAYRRAVAHFKH
jgi:phosphatidylinositol alpha-mannosyltransferase